MKAGDRVTVIAETDEYLGLSGEIVEVTKDGNLAVNVEIPKKFRAVFKPHDVELEKLAKRRRS